MRRDGLSKVESGRGRFPAGMTERSTTASPLASTTATVEGDTGASAVVDFARRVDPADLPEWMDEPCSYEEFRACVRDLGWVNRLTFGHRPTLQFLGQVAATREGLGRPLRIVDVGSGGGDALRRIALWAARRRVAVELMGVDLNPHATRAAEEFSGRNQAFSGIRWCTGNAYTEPAAQDGDVVISSLMTHHMCDEEIVAFLRWMEAHAPRGWFINDLLRSARTAHWFGVLAKVMRWHPFVRHDGPVSFRRAFRSEDWRQLLQKAGIPLDAVRLSQPVPGRLCLTRLR